MWLTLQTTCRSLYIFTRCASKLCHYVIVWSGLKVQIGNSLCSLITICVCSTKSLCLIYVNCTDEKWSGYVYITNNINHNLCSAHTNWTVAFISHGTLHGNQNKPQCTVQGAVICGRLSVIGRNRTSFLFPLWFGRITGQLNSCFFFVDWKFPQNTLVIIFDNSTYIRIIRLIRLMWHNWVSMFFFYKLLMFDLSLLNYVIQEIGRSKAVRIIF